MSGEIEKRMNLGVQYYRPPFPNRKYWEEDMARIADSGLNSVQLWVVWAWVESKPGEFDYGDYDRLVELADRHGLEVVLSTIAEIHPYWIHHKIPGSEMIDHMGNKVVSSNRGEIHFGITPGGCFDHPEVWKRMEEFLVRTVEQYRGASNLFGWDAWNELRWNVQSDGLVCFCEHTLTAFREWLDEKYGGLEGLNAAWQRRYGHWREVMPGKLPDRPYTEMMAFEHFLTCRSDEQALNRYQVMKGLDPDRPVTVHGGAPTPLYGGSANDQPLNRGNDWNFADGLDGVGCSSFPKWFGIDDADFGFRVEFVRSAARKKLIWLSEVQGGRASIGFNSYQPVDALSQQRWIWNGFACGANAILFWCWRDEVFGRESSGFGLVGNDGLAEERLAAMRVTGKLVRQHRELLVDYEPVKPEVGVLFSPQSYYLNWAQERNAQRTMNGLSGYCRALVRSSIPYLVVEETHLEELDGLKVLFMPRVLVTDEETEERLEGFVRDGGVLVCESECGAFASNGLYRYPEDRFVARLTGGCEVGRRALPGEAIPVNMDGESLDLGISQWTTPWERGKGKVRAEQEDGGLVVEVPVGEGKLVLCGSYFGEAYYEENYIDFERFIELQARAAGWKPQVEVASPQPKVDSFVYIRHGEALGKKVVYVFFPDGEERAKLRFAPGFFGGERVTDLISGDELEIGSDGERQACSVPVSDWRFSVLVEK